MKMWSGRFRGSLDEAADAFNSSLPFDGRLYKHDILGSIAHATMLGETGIIDKAEADAICAAFRTSSTTSKAARCRSKGRKISICSSRRS